MLYVAEEIQNAPVTIPKTMIYSIILNGVLGLSIIMALVFSMGDIGQAISSPTAFPFIEIFVYASGSVTGGTAMVRNTQTSQSRTQPLIVTRPSSSSL